MINVIAFDLSLLATGVAMKQGVRTISPPAKLIGVARLAFLRDIILRRAVEADLIVLEGYAFNRTNQAHQLGELGGVVRLALHDNRIPYVDIAPTMLKKFATGKGNASKAEMLGAAIRRLLYNGHNHNEADALWLRALALDHYGIRPADVPALHRKSLDRIPWPFEPAPMLAEV